MSESFIKNLVEQKAIEFVKNLRGKCESHVSETFIISYLTHAFVQIHKQNPSALEIVIAYSSAIMLFKDVLEIGCKLEINGDIIAQDFASRFSERPVYY